jgi:3-dehydroquinate dehydratase type I
MTQEKGRVSSRLCISISASNFTLLKQKFNFARSFKPGFIEFRLDYLKNLDRMKLKLLREMLQDNEILTVRAKSEGGNPKLNEKKRISLLRNVLSISPKFLDVEIATLNKYQSILHDVLSTKTRLIASFHDLHGSKNSADLREMIWKAPLGSKSLYAIKIVSKANTRADNKKILSLYKSEIFKGKNAPKLVAFCTGKMGVESRIKCLLAGSPFSYCSLPGEPLASGQLDFESMKEAVSERFA